MDNPGSWLHNEDRIRWAQGRALWGRERASPEMKAISQTSASTLGSGRHDFLAQPAAWDPGFDDNPN